MKILFTSVGRRVELVQAFRGAANQLNLELKILGADMTDSAPALCFCDKTVIVPRITDPHYIPTLLDVCKKESVDLLIPTIDTDLLILAQHKADFKKIGTTVLISEPEKIAVCRDKRETYQFFCRVGVDAPETVDDCELYRAGFPAFIKPKDGSSSVFAYKVNSKEELLEYAKQVPNYIIQPYIDGVEYTVDVFCDFHGNPIHITPRIRQAVRAGEVLKTKISQDKQILEEMKRILAEFKPCGPITVQLIREKDTGKDYFIEINPRFGGGAPLSMKAGADSARSLLQMLKGEEIDIVSGTAKNGAEYSRFDQSICVCEGSNSLTIKGVVFDLDDTLYSEKQYVRSGYKKIAEYLGNVDAEEKMWSFFLAGMPAIDAYLTSINQQDKKEECLAVYRNQMPEITLYEGVIDLLKALKMNGIKLGIITDGRVEGQKNKIQALGVAALVDDIIITDELGGPQFRKPNDISFRIMQNRWGIPFAQMVYVGDNPTKDFLAPKQLGIKSVFFENGDGLYSNQYTEDGNLIKAKNISELSAVLGE